MAELPSGTVTFLFTDIEGSTRLLHELGDGYAEVLAEHRRALREVFARHDGVEVDTQGDAFFVAFAKAPDALAAAADGRDALADSLIKVRIGLHTGEPLVTKEGYVGIDVHRAARICSAAHGGQVVLSERTANLLEGGFELRELGLHRLKDLGRPEKLFQLGREEFPTLRSLNATNLPAQPSPLVGRERELDELLPIVRQRRLVTLAGPGGTGKTRLGLQVAAELVDEFKDGVFWVPLAALTDSELVEPTIAHTLGAKEGLAEHIGDRHMMLLLDNFEQLLPAAPALSELLARCANLHILTTSRALLRVAAEREYLVEPLPEDDAVSLFVERAAQAEPDNAVAAICRRLDGLPLAIELAAARTRLLPPVELLKRLEKALPLLTSGLRDAPVRQQTLRATIEWSYDLLTAAERVLFADIAVFAGSFSLEAAERVCGAKLSTLESLVEQSLVRRWESGRLGMLETIREFALERLEASGEAEELRRRHADHFLALAEQSAPELREGHYGDWLELLDSEYTNLRAATEWADQSGKDELGLRLLLALSYFWEARGYLDEGGRRFDEALDHRELTPEQRLLILGWAAAFASLRGEFGRAESLLEERLALIRERLARARDVRDEIRHVDTLRSLGTAQIELGELPRARELLEESVALANRLPDKGARQRILSTADLGYVLLVEGQHRRAISVYEEVVAVSLKRGDTLVACNCLLNIGSAELRSGRPREAIIRLREALTYAYELGYPEGIADCLTVLAAAASREGRTRRAAIILGASDALRETLGYSLQRIEREMRELAAAAARKRLETEGFELALAEGRMMSPDDAVAYALGEKNLGRGTDPA